MFNKIYDKTRKFLKENYKFIIALIAIVLLFNIETPYSIEMPGGYISLNDRVKIDNKNTTSGSFGLAYVSMLKGSIPFVLISYLNNDWDLVSKEDLRYNNENDKEMELREKLSLNEAISNASLVAYTKANKKIIIKNKYLVVSYNDNDKSNLKVGDKIISVNDNYLNDLKELQDYIQTLDINSMVKVKVVRNNKEEIIETPLKDYDGVKKIGVAIINNYELETNPNLDVSAKNNESGPSGGLMLALSIYDNLVDDDLTKGEKVIGTGTIDIDGNVGEIGGVKYKLIGAVNTHAKIFLCPKDNYEEAISIAREKNYDIIIKSVSTFDEAVNYLKER